MNDVLAAEIAENTVVFLDDELKGYNLRMNPRTIKTLQELIVYLLLGETSPA